MENKRTPIPVPRIIEKLDSYLHKNDYGSAERLLKYWHSEAAANSDEGGRLTVLNEQIGLYRKLLKKDECLEAIKEALALAEGLHSLNQVTKATTYLNAATGYKAFGSSEMSLPLYKRAEKIYIAELEPFDPRFGGLYNNMALALADLKCFDEAKAAYEKAIEVMKRKEHGETEIAITYLNLADLTAAKCGMIDGSDEIFGYLDLAEEMLNTKSLPHDGYFAFVCDKCAPVFGYYGYFSAEKKYKELSEQIYKEQSAQ